MTSHNRSILEIDFNNKETCKENFDREVLSSDKCMNTLYKMNVYKNTNIPSSLFRFRECNIKNIKSIKNNRLWFSNPNDFNDPYDSYISFNFKKEFSKNSESYKPVLESIQQAKLFTNDELDEIFIAGHKYDKLQEIIYKNYNKEIQQKINLYITEIEENFYNSLSNEKNKYFKNKLKVCCLSESKKSIKMWSHYADEHKGFCVEYETSRFKNRDNIYPVVYTNSLIDSSSYNIIESGFIPALIIKAEEWRDEEEWRIIKETEDKFYIEAKPKAIYLGCEIKIGVKRLCVLKSYCEKNSIALYQARMKSNEFMLNFSTIYQP